MPDLFDPITIGGVRLPNRIWMSAMTRTRATPDNVPTALMRDYFSQRAAAGLIATDCTAVSAQGKGVVNGPGIWREDQIEGWKQVTEGVHAAGGRIYCQLWHCGRVAHPDMRDGEPPVAPSPLPATGKFRTPDGELDFPVPRELEADEIPEIVEDFIQATLNARAAGFDGVELHAANGYLHDQFLRDGSNQRSDGWGGPPAARARLIVETLEAMIAAWSAERVGIKLSPSTSLYGMSDGDPFATFAHVLGEIDRLKIGYVAMVEPNAKDRELGVTIENVAETFRPLVSLPFVTNSGYDKARGTTALTTGHADAVAYGSLYIANPDLTDRFARDAALNPPDPATFYGEGPHGYTDYPTLAD